MDDEDPKYPDFGNTPPRVLSTQIALATALGISALISFSILRFKWPKLYAARTARKRGLPKLPQSMWTWIIALYNITEDQVLEHAGLDAFVFLGFFKTAIQLLTICTVCAMTIISPIRLRYTGNYDQGENFLMRRKDGGTPDFGDPEDYSVYLWVYVIFTYVFTILTAYFMMRQTVKVISVRQSYLGGQNSITDRTIRVSGISKSLRTEAALKQHIESIGIGSVRSVSFCRDWSTLDQLFDRRDEIIFKLERAWSEYLGPTWLNDLDTAADDAEDRESESDETISLLGHSRGGGIQLGLSQRGYKRPTERTLLFGLWGTKVDIIDKYSFELEKIDDLITAERQKEFAATNQAFVTVDSVATAQMTAQALLDPRPHRLIAHTAPAPHDVIWRNLYMSPKERTIRSYVITLLIAIISVFMAFPTFSLAPFLEVKTIKKFWPGLAKLLESNEFLLTFVTGVLPTLLFTLISSVIPYLYSYLSTLQGFLSHGDVELSVISKNFFYIFLMFMVFTVASTASSYWSYLKDTTQISMELAKALRKFSLFYVDLIILQGIGMFPFRLLQIGSVVRFPLFAASCKSPRDYRDLYKPPIFNYGIHLPQPIMILIIILLYSVMSSKILAFGTIYFIFGYFTYKYQLMYSMIHPQHSTGKAWPLIVRRVCLGLILFHLAMAGILSLNRAYFLSTLLTPLPIATMVYIYNFEESIVPLLHFIALRAIKTTDSQAVSNEDTEDDDLTPEAEARARALRRVRSQSKTLDEQREQFLTYINPNLTKPLDGPWLGIEGDEIILANSEGTRRRKVRFEEWE